MKVAEKKIRQSSKHSFNKQLDQMQSTLIRNGFSREVINDVRSEYREETDQDAELEALQHHGERLLRRYQGKYDDYELRNKLDRKSTRLNSSHVAISYAVFCLKNKKRRRSN